MPKSLVLLLLAFAAAQAQSGKVTISVAETSGIRRTAFPVTAQVRNPRAAARLTQAGKEVPAQFTQAGDWLDVDFNASIGPLEKTDYVLEFGPDVAKGEAPRGLNVVAGTDTITVGAIQFNRGGSPLIASVKYRGEDIGKGSNGLFVTDDKGNHVGVAKAQAEVVKTGPLVAVVRYSGVIALPDGSQAPFTLTAEMPNSKTMIKLTAVVQDPGRRIREIAIDTPLAFAALPLEWDFGTSRWTYGVLRTAADSVTFTQDTAGWRATTGANDQLYETSAATEKVRWGHLQDGKEVVAFAFDANGAGVWRTRFEGSGQTSFRFAPAAPSSEHQITVMEHFVAAPVQIGAATSPSALLSPLSVAVTR